MTGIKPRTGCVEKRYEANAGELFAFVVAAEELRQRALRVHLPDEGANYFSFISQIKLVKPSRQPVSRSSLPLLAPPPLLARALVTKSYQGKGTIAGEGTTPGW